MGRLSDASLYDIGTARVLKREGQDRASTYRKERLLRLREIAVLIAASRGSREITIEAVRRQAEVEGMDFEGMKMVMGSVFRDKRFEPTGRHVQSTRTKAHARPVQVWRLK